MYAIAITPNNKMLARTIVIFPIFSGLIFFSVTFITPYFICNPPAPDKTIYQGAGVIP